MLEESDFLLTKKERVEKYRQQYYKAKEDSRRGDLDAALTSVCEEPNASESSTRLHVARPTVCSDIRRRSSNASISANYQMNVPLRKRRQPKFTSSSGISKEAS